MATTLVRRPYLPGHIAAHDPPPRAVKTCGVGVGQQEEQQESLVETERVDGGTKTAARSPRDRQLMAAASGY